MTLGNVVADYALVLYFVSFFLNAFAWSVIDSTPIETGTGDAMDGKGHTSFSSRIRTSFKLLCTPRGIGWSHEPKSAISPSPVASTKPISFVMKQIITGSIKFFLLDGLNAYLGLIPAFHVGGPSIADTTFIWRCVNTGAFAISAATSMSAMYDITSVVSVCLGLSKPHEWPPLFGSVRYASTIRGFWG
ncbi:hypothetical protein VNI00_017027 [Paramarasmius palmivorus]|uniref:Uncharacterized protein n=1 Tax=Paramarasmius palmivorus TaxID=297713 RepID=A0AAW0BC18_9AGAR